MRRVAVPARLGQPYRDAVSSPRTVWEEGRTPGRRVATLAAGATAAVALLDLALTGRLGMLFDLSFVLVCLAAASAVGRRDFFGIAVTPPLLMLATVLVLAGVAPAAVAEADDAMAQAVVSGLAHHATSLAAGYAAALLTLGVRQAGARQLPHPRA